MSAAPIAENNAERARLTSLVGRLTDTDLAHPIGDMWTVAVALAHLAFWDRRALLLLDCWERGQVPPAGEPDWYGSEVLNNGLLAEWRALLPRATARLALEAAAAIDHKIEQLDARLAEAVIARDEAWLIHRYRHRRDHLDQADRILGARDGPAC